MIIVETSPMECAVRPATLADVQWLYDHSDFKGDKYPMIGLRQHIEQSQRSWVGIANEEIAVGWGVIPVSFMSENAYIWVVGTSIIRKNPFLFIRMADLVFNEMIKHYNKLYGFCLPDKPLAMKWVRRYGAIFGPPIEDGNIPFEIRRPT